MSDANENVQAFLRATELVDADHPAVIEFAQGITSRVANPVTRARMLYLAVRDGFRYDPYRLDLSVAGMKASKVLSDGYGWCVNKSALLAAACRAAGIPAKVGYADVRNHLSTERLRQAIGSDIYYWHSYTVIHLNGKWLKATPAFNVELCEKLDLFPLEFDGSTDSIYHPYSRAGDRHMEYVAYRGEFLEVPREEIVASMQLHYPALLKLPGEAEFERDLDREMA